VYEEDLAGHPSNLFLEEDYQHILMVNGFDKIIQSEYLLYSATGQASKKVLGYYYDLANKNIYAKVLFATRVGVGVRSRLVMDYNSVKTKIIFDEAAEKEDWKTLYEHTKFLINLGSSSALFSFQFIPYDQKYLSRPFAIITAFNPNMKDDGRTAEENLKANAELYSMLEEKKYHFLPSNGELFEHSEASYIVYGIALEEALAIGRIFGQESIVYNDGEIVAVVDCKTAINVIELDHFEIYIRLKKDTVNAKK